MKVSKISLGMCGGGHVILVLMIKIFLYIMEMKSQIVQNGVFGCLQEVPGEF